MLKAMLTPSSSFNPASLGWYAAYWASDPLWLAPSNGSNVSSWRDLSGNGRTITASGTPPVMATTGFNGLPAVRFASGTKPIGAALSPSLAQPDSVVVIADPTGTNADNQTRFYDSYAFGTGGDANRRLVGGNGASGYYIYAGSLFSISTFGAASLAPALLAGVFKGASSFMYRNGATSGTGNTGTAGNSNGIGIGGDGASSIFIGDIAFVGIYSGNVTANALWPAFCAWASATYGLGF